MPEKTTLGSFGHLQSCCGAAVNGVIKVAMENESTDNLSVILLLFKNFQATA